MSLGQSGIPSLTRAEQGAGVGNQADVHLISKSQVAESVSEWRSREDVETPNSSGLPSICDTDDEEEASSLSSVVGSKPSDLYGKFTWKIESFSEISKREIRSNVFKVGGYKWYILVYPQGCEVCNHLSLFLCVADHDELLPGWNQFAQFTIAVVNKDPKKSKYSDTLHRFCRKEHDWGWKKFMELSKVLDGFTVADTLVIKAQVQVIRENLNRPFRCLDFQYRRELIRVYMTNIEAICRRFVEEKREKLGKLMEDAVRWGSFRTFWMAVDVPRRHNLSQEKTDVVFKAIVKRFCNEKEVTSTLVMDALYSGSKALSCRNTNWKAKVDRSDSGQASVPLVWIDKDFFILSGDILTLLERASTETLPSYKDEKVPQNRVKEGKSTDDTGKDYFERDELCLTDLGRRTIEMFVLTHLFSNRVEVAYREAIALKRQEELIREEEVAGMIESELKAKREAVEKEKRSKKKQAKQRRKDRKQKGKVSLDKRLQAEQAPGIHDRASGNRMTHHNPARDPELSSVNLTETGDDEDDSVVLDASDDMGTSILVNDEVEADRISWREGFHTAQGMEARFSGSVSDDAKWTACTSKKEAARLDDSSSTCSSDSLPHIQPVTNVSLGHRPALADRTYALPRRRITTETEPHESGERSRSEDLHTCSVARGTGEASSSSSVNIDGQTLVHSLKDQIQWLEKCLLEKEEETTLLKERLSLLQLQVRPHANGPSNSSLNNAAPVQKLPVEDCEMRQELPNPLLCNAVDTSSTGSRGVHTTSMAKPGKSHTQHGKVKKASNSADLNRSPCVTGKGSGDFTSGVATQKNALLRPPVSWSKNSDSSVEKPCSRNRHADDPNHVSCISHSTKNSAPSYSRPASAPVFANNQAPSTGFSSFRAEPSLVRSNSAIGSLSGAVDSATGTNGMAARQTEFVAPVALSYRNATVHKLQPSSSFGAVNYFVHNSSNPSNNTVPEVLSVFDNAHQDSLASSCITGSEATCSLRSSSVLDLSMIDGQPPPTSDNGAGDAAFLAVPTCNMSIFKEGQIQSSPINNQLEVPDDSIAFTFGTITQEVLHNEQKEHGQPPDNPRMREHQLQVCENESDNKELLQELTPKHHDQDFIENQHQLCFNPTARCHEQYRTPAKCVLQSQQVHLDNDRSSLATAVRQVRGAHPLVEHLNSSNTMLTEEFPHLDIINELLDEDKSLEKALGAILQQPSNQKLNRQVSLSKVRSFTNAQPSNEFSQYSTASDRGSVGIRFSQKQSDGMSSASSANLQQQKESYIPIPVSQFQDVCMGATDGLSSQFWSLGQGMRLPSGYEVSMQNGFTPHLPYPLIQSHQISAADCAGLVGYDGLTYFAPLQSP